MKIITLKDFKPEWIEHRFPLCNLPTEIVYPCKYSGETFDVGLVIMKAYAYRVYTSGVRIGEKYYNFPMQYAIEVHENWGDDGHVHFTFRNKFVLVNDTDIDVNNFSTKDYIALMTKADELERKTYDEDKQMTLKDYAYERYGRRICDWD